MSIDPVDAFGLLRSFLAHRAYLAEAHGLLRAELERRAVVHDLSKLSDDEFAGFSRINAAARVQKFGSPEYQAGINAERPVVDLHFLRNSHHPERPKLAGQAAEGSARPARRCDLLGSASGRTPHLSRRHRDGVRLVCSMEGLRRQAAVARERQAQLGEERRAPLSRAAVARSGSYRLPLEAWLSFDGAALNLGEEKAERAEWRAEQLRRTELCEAQGGIPRYEIRGRSYDGCDFPPSVQR